MEALITKISSYELERGKPIPSKNHSIVQSNLIFLIRKLYEDSFRVMPEIRISILDKERVPDIALYKYVAFTPGLDEIRLSEVPLCAIEILSPTQSLSELITKSAIYFEGGVASYWLVLPDLRIIYIFSAPNEYNIFAKKALLVDDKIGIELELQEVFR